MKRFLSYILIFVVIMQLFAPFTIGSQNKKLSVRTVQADTMKADVNNVIFVTDKTITVTTTVGKAENVSAIWTSLKGLDKASIRVTAILYDQSEKEIQSRFKTIRELDIGKPFDLLFDDKKLLPETKYKLVINLEKSLVETSYLDPEKPAVQGNTILIETQEFNPKTLPKGNTTPENTGLGGNLSGETKGVEPDDGLMKCDVLHIGGCIANIFFYVFFKPTSFFFGLTGKMLDFTFMYSISDSAYRSAFVTEGWEIVRDFCNMFFIFVLLYIAFQTILNLGGGSKSKSLIINVVIIGLLINFSLFASHIVIDASNILARVFYNQKTMIIGEVDNNTKDIKNETGVFGEIKLSEIIVKSVNPVKLLNNTEEVGKYNTNKGVGIKGESQSGITNSNFIVVTLLASAINIVGMLAFLSIALAFLGRVITLWLSMILAPIAFFSYTVPSLQKLPMIGFSNWWSGLISASFMAPVFAFFMYIIAKFLEKGLGLSSVLDKGKSGLELVIAVMVPFIFIMILITRAKSIAVKMSGEIGQQATTALSAAAGIALGGAALGTGALLRNSVGRTMAKASRGETSSQKYDVARRLDAANGNSEAMDALSKKQKFIGSLGSRVGLHKLYGKVETKTTGVTTGNVTAIKRVVSDKISGGVGGALNSKQEKVDKIDKARSKWDETKKEIGAEKTEDRNLSRKDITAMQKKFKDKNKGEYETEAKNGEISLKDASGQEVKSLINPTQTIKGEKTFKADREGAVTTNYIAEQQAAGRIGLNLATLNKQDKAKIKDQLDSEFRAVLKTTVEHRSDEKFKETREKAKEGISMVDRGVAGANKHSYDISNLSKLKTDKRDGFFSRIPVGLIAAIAAGVRGGMKSSGLTSGASSQGSFLKDMGSVISESLKKTGIKIDISGDSKK